MSDFLAMGGHGPYVWSAYAVTAVVVALNIWAARRAHLRALERWTKERSAPRAERRPVVTRVE